MTILLGFDSKITRFNLIKGVFGLLCQVISNFLYLAMEAGETLLQCWLLLGLCLHFNCKLLLFY